MNISRRNFIGGASTLGLGLALSGYRSAFAAAACCKGAKPGIALQLYSLNRYIGGYKRKDGTVVLAPAGLEKALAEVAKIGYKAVEFAGYYNHSAAELKKMLADNGLAVCGTHVSNDKYGFDTKKFTYDPEVLKKTAEFELSYGNNLVICPGGGNFPPGCSWSTGQGGEPCKPSQAIDDFTKRLVELYNKAAADATKLGIKIGLHNHTWEHAIVMQDGTSFWDYFFSNTDKAVQMEQDVGWSVCAGVDPCEQFRKYPGRSINIHAKENGMGKGVKKFDAILGQPGEPGAKPVPWDDVIKATTADGVKWFVVECERHFDTLEAVTPSFAFLKSKGL